MIEFIEGIKSELLVGFFTILGAAIGAAMSSKSQRKESKRQMVSDAYCNFFAAAYAYLNRNTSDNYISVLVAIEQCRFVCCSEACDPMMSVTDLLEKKKRTDAEYKDLERLLKELHHVADKDVAKYDG